MKALLATILEHLAGHVLKVAARLVEVADRIDPLTHEVPSPNGHDALLDEERLA